MLRHDVVEPVHRHAIRVGDLVRSRTAWALTIFFAAQSFQAYIAFGWFADFLHAHGESKSTAGYLVALMAGLTIPVSMVAPTVAAHAHRALVVVLGLAFLVSYIGLALAPVGGAVVWMILSGIGSGMFRWR